MEPYTNTETVRTANGSARYIIVVLILLVFVFAFLWGRTLTAPKKTPVDDLSAKLAEEHKVLMTNMLLQSQFGYLQQLDERVIRAASSPEPANLDYLNTKINDAEDAFKHSIDSIEKQTVKVNAWANVTMIDSITSSYRRALANRIMMANFRDAVKNGTQTLPEDQQKLLELQYSVQERDLKIMQLQKQVANFSSGPPRQREEPVKETITEKPGNDMEKQLKDEEMRNTGLLDITNGLKEENKRLQDELKKVRSSIAYNQSAYNSATNKTSSLQEQVAQLSSDLKFAQIDCNLMRADPSKNVSSSKQRKDLLNDVKQTLQELNLSDNFLIQQKAKEKFRELNAIALGVRD